jgi:hypothetical protein
LWWLLRLVSTARGQPWRLCQNKIYSSFPPHAWNMLSWSSQSLYLKKVKHYFPSP